MANTDGLSVQHVTRRFEGNAAVNDVSFEVGAGELVALVGASGSGKTTSLRIVAGYEIPDAGEVRFGGADITRTPPEKRGFGMVFQHYALFPHMSVVENVAFGLEARGVAKGERLRRAERALESVGLQGKGGRKIQQLSGGEQQRVALARAVVIEPKMWLLDEPLSNLDPALRQNMRDELRAMLHRVGAPALFVTHDQEDAFAVADRIVLLARGRVLQIGAPEELYTRPASRDVATFIGRATLVPARDRGGSADVSIGGVTQTLHVTRPNDGQSPFPDALVVLRPETLTLSGAGAADAWPGVVTGRRFAGATTVYHVQLSEQVTVEVPSRHRAMEGESVSVLPPSTPVPIVAA